MAGRDTCVLALHARCAGLPCMLSTLHRDAPPLPGRFHDVRCPELELSEDEEAEDLRSKASQARPPPHLSSCTDRRVRVSLQPSVRCPLTPCLLPLRAPSCAFPARSSVALLSLPSTRVPARPHPPLPPPPPNPRPTACCQPCQAHGAVSAAGREHAGHLGCALRAAGGGRARGQQDGASVQVSPRASCAAAALVACGCARAEGWHVLECATLALGSVPEGAAQERGLSWAQLQRAQCSAVTILDADSGLFKSPMSSCFGLMG